MNNTPEIRMTKVYNDRLPKLPPHGLNPSLEQARATLIGLLDSLGEYETAADKSRALALLMTPALVKWGVGGLTPEQCPPFKIRPKAAKALFAGVLAALYGEDAPLGCTLR
jgi:hypothetical protein